MNWPGASEGSQFWVQCWSLLRLVKFRPWISAQHDVIIEDPGTGQNVTSLQMLCPERVRTAKRVFECLVGWLGRGLGFRGALGLC